MFWLTLSQIEDLFTGNSPLPTCTPPLSPSTPSRTIYIYLTAGCRVFASPDLDSCFCLSGGVVKDVCGCCDVCAKQAGQICGGPWELAGRCDKGLACVVRKHGVVVKPMMKPGQCEQGMVNPLWPPLSSHHLHTLPTQHPPSLPLTQHPPPSLHKITSSLPYTQSSSLSFTPPRPPSLDNTTRPSFHTTSPILPTQLPIPASFTAPTPPSLHNSPPLPSLHTTPAFPSCLRVFCSS